MNGLRMAPTSGPGAVTEVGGAAVARNLSNRLLRRVLLVAVLTLAVKTLVYDASW